MKNRQLPPFVGRRKPDEAQANSRNAARVGRNLNTPESKPEPSTQRNRTSESVDEDQVEVGHDAR